MLGYGCLSLVEFLSLMQLKCCVVAQTMMRMQLMLLRLRGVRWFSVTEAPTLLLLCLMMRLQLTRL